MVIKFIGFVLFVVGAFMAVRPKKYHEVGNVMRKNPEEPDATYLKIIRGMGIVLVLIAVAMVVASMWPKLSGSEIEVKTGSNWEVAFTEDVQLAELIEIPSGANAVPYEAVSDGQNIYFLGWAKKDGAKTGQPGIYKVPADGDFAGEAELLAALDGAAGQYGTLLLGRRGKREAGEENLQQQVSAAYRRRLDWGCD